MGEQAIKLTVEKSQQQANIIGSIGIMIHALDLEYCELLKNAMFDQAGRQEGLAVLLPAHPQSKNDLLRMQAQAMGHLLNYVHSLQKIDELKEHVKKDLAQQSDIAKLFI